ncbi:hypothetical protein [Faecalispora jeddahensis]|uniref:hypothetical protein n=1 Tax=Faecalispora jeddahensis TaxID=1414721 RepID=UPI0027B8FFBE|nr:hypothetical protein [Faecalispora jeddahensis]
MNTYRVTATRSDGTQVEDKFTEATEGAARKAFKECYRHDTYEITGIELIGENAQASKQQERDTLEKIKKLVETLGPDSYVATAFDGCFEIAEWNIDADAADSLKGRLEMAEGKITQGVEELQQARKDLGAARAEVERLKIERDELARRIPAADDLADCIALTKDKASEHEQQMNEAAARIVQLAGEPGGPEFRQAVTDHRNAKSALEYCKALQERLSSIVTAGA